MAKPAIAEKAEATETELTGEYVSGAGYYNTTRLSLEGYDYFRSNLNGEAIQRLRYDSEVESSVEFLVDAVFAEGIQAISPLSENEDPEFKEAFEIAQFVNKAIGSAQRKLVTVMREIFRGTYYNGVKAAEIILKVDDDNNLVLDRLNPKPNHVISFVCDKFLNVLGLATWLTAYKPEELLNRKNEIIPRDKFLILQFELEDNDPRGVKKIRAAFDDYCDKQTTRRQYEEWRRTSAIPKKVGIAGPGQKEIPLKDADGKTIVKDGIPVTTTAEKALMKALEGFANNSAITAPNGTVIMQLEVEGNGEQFIMALKSSNTGIRKAILGDSVSTGEDDKGVKAAKVVAMNVVDLRVMAMKNLVAEAVERDIFRLLTVVNFGKEKAHLSPLCSLGDTERRDWATDLSAAGSAGYEFAPEHFPALDVQFGQKPRKELPEAARISETRQKQKKANDNQPQEKTK